MNFTLICSGKQSRATKTPWPGWTSLIPWEKNCISKKVVDIVPVAAFTHYYPK
jgi:hypothetical protein